MYLHSANNPMPKPTENVPVFLFCFEQRTVFMKRRETYEDMITALRIKFDIPDNVNPILRVSTLDICHEREIEVDEDAYEAMAPFLDEIKIVLTPRSNDKGKGRSIRKHASPALTARRIPAKTKSVLSESRTPKVVNAAELFANDDHLTDEGGQDDEEIDATQPPSSSSSHETGRSWEEVEESDTERRNVRKVFEADKSMMIVKQEIEEIVSPKASGPSGLNTSPAKKERSSGPGVRNPSPRKERYEEPGVQASGEDDLDKHFEVTVIGPQDNQRARLKTRGRYQVKKVLHGVCKSFGIPFDTAKLIHIVKFVEDGTEVVEQFECDNDETIAYCGIKENAQLAVILQEDDDDSYDEDEE
ncbi:uncharacterized protein EV420DRAFT_155361 [Desarmillaria tabescens]|uniref:Uncharacterized protein n=1 Tax=Armillaria tabescens TaxID=1929756 RepID=A0AA39J8D8_ARMTA|nr:uncharacterized protein EV420DRAFT_155361 [Desarmillaria tabescens]KAK0437933.1 hypothetical protein EV420DRAFT_155361 [Desarmillaria tabescens]